MMRKYMRQSLIFTFLSLIFFLIINSTPVAAQEGDEGIVDYQPDDIEANLGNVIPFELLGFTGHTLSNSQKAAVMNFSTPAHWQLTEDVELVLDIFTTVHDNNLQVEGLIGGWIDVKFNGTLLETYPINGNGLQTINLTIPATLLTDQIDKRRNSLIISLKTNFGCNSTQESIVDILPSSYFNIPHQFSAPGLDLQQLPFPIQQGSFLPDEALLVVPTTPTQTELEAVMIAAAGLGRLTNRTKIQLVQYDDLTEEMLAAYHIILVGQPSQFPTMDQVPFTISLTADDFNAKAAGSSNNKRSHEAQSTTIAKTMADFENTDGVLQIAHSPWNIAKVVVYIGGNSDEGTVKAAKAIGFGQVRTGNDPSLAIINEVYFEVPGLPALKSTQTFTELGYELKTLYGPSSDSTNYTFFIPPNMEVPEDETASLSLVYNHSELLEYDLSGLNILINNRPVKSLRLHEESSTVTVELIELPAMMLRPGENTIKFSTELAPMDTCSDLKESGSWLNIFPETSLYLPLTAITNLEIPSQMLNQYPLPIVYDDNLSTAAFVLPTDDSVAWFAAVQVAFELGQLVEGDILNIQVAFADDVPETMRQEDNLIIIGRPADLAVLADLEAFLPVPLSFETNRFEHDRLPIEYEISPEVNLGYLNLIASPWNIENIVLSILGDSDEGIQNATSALLIGRRNLTGDLAVIEADQIFVTATPSLVSAENIDDSVEETEETTAVTGPTDSAESTEETAVSSESDNITEEANPDQTATEEAMSTVNDTATGEAVQEATKPPAAANTNTQTPNFLQRDGAILPIAVLVLCVVALAGLGVYFFLSRRNAS